MDEMNAISTPKNRSMGECGDKRGSVILMM